MTRLKMLFVGEAMVEMAPLPDGTYQRGFAGDTFNSAWHVAQVLGDSADVGFVTRVGTDTLSNAFLDELKSDGLSAAYVSRDEHRTMGLYMITLDGVERSFQYWRSASAARHLADYPDALAESFDAARLIHLSGITVAILAQEARASLLAELRVARAHGTRISFDPNIRPTLWSGMDEVRDVLPSFLSAADIILPSFDDESRVWGDASPAQTVDRLSDFGAAEIVVKNGPDPVFISNEGIVSVHATPSVPNVRDTTGAGDAFNAGYLMSRITGQEVPAAVRAGHRLSALALTQPGARANRKALQTFEL